MSDRFFGMTAEQLDLNHVIESDDGWFCDTCRRPVGNPGEDPGMPGSKSHHTGTRPDDFD